MKRSVPLSQIRDTPVSVRLHGELPEPPPLPQVSPFRAPSPEERHRHRMARVVRPMCIWPGCPKTVGAWPNTKLCGAHVAIVVNDYQRGITNSRGEMPVYDVLADCMKPMTVTPTRRAAPTDGTVYFLQVGGHIKIGWTSDMAKRMRTYPPNAVLLATHPGERKDELRLHRMFAVHCSHGREWYPLVPVILAHIKRVIAEHGLPEEITFGAKPKTVPRPHSTAGQPHPKNYPLGSPKVMRG